MRGWLLCLLVKGVDSLLGLSVHLLIRHIRLWGFYIA